MTSKNVRGFTLIELMVAIAVIAILVAIAVPSYKKHIRDTRRSDAYVALVGLAQAQETFYTEKRTYANFLGTETTDDTIRCFSFCKPNSGLALSPDGHYKIGIGAGNTGKISNSFVIVATARGIQEKNEEAGCRILTLNSLGQKLPEDCW